MKFRNIALYLTLLLAVSTLPLFAQSTPPTGTTGGKVTQTSKPKSSPIAPAEKIDINSATKEQLDALPGVGSAYSQKIIDGRPYKSKRDLLTRKIISQGTYDGIQDEIIAHRAPGAQSKSSADTGPKPQ